MLVLVHTLCTYCFTDSMYRNVVKRENQCFAASAGAGSVLSVLKVWRHGLGEHARFGIVDP